MHVQRTGCVGFDVRNGIRSRGEFDEDEDAYLVPSDWEDDGDDDDWGTGTAARRARDRLGKLNEVTLKISDILRSTKYHIA